MPRSRRNNRRAIHQGLFCITSAAALACVGRATAAEPLFFDRPDLHAHFWASFGLALPLTEVLEGPDPAWGPQWGTGWATLAATGVVGAIGLFKEVALDDGVDPDDLIADALGLAANALLQVTIRF